MRTEFAQGAVRIWTGGGDVDGVERGYWVAFIGY